jgi:hypothetical protein
MLLGTLALIHVALFFVFIPLLQQKCEKAYSRFHYQGNK